MDKINLICKGCGYKFKRTAETRTNTCPYCGSKKVEDYKPTLASDLLKSIPSE